MIIVLNKFILKNIIILSFTLLFCCKGPVNVINNYSEFESIIVINEINYHSHDNFNTEDWIELYNNGDNSIDIGNWILMDQNGSNKYYIPQGTLINPNNYIILAQDFELFNGIHGEIENIIGNIGFGFSSSGDIIRLFNSENELVDIVEYEDDFPWPNEPDGNGPTLELIDPNNDNNNPLNWSASNSNGSPGSKNN